jgi:hypothetical protein
VVSAGEGDRIADFCIRLAEQHCPADDAPAVSVLASVSTVSDSTDDALAAVRGASDAWGESRGEGCKVVARCPSG